MKATDAWNKFMKSGNVEDYLNYRREIENSDSIFNPNENNIFEANNEKSAKRYRDPRSGLWGK